MERTRPLLRRRPESNRCTGLCRPLPKPLGHAAGTGHVSRRTIWTTLGHRGPYRGHGAPTFGPGRSRLTSGDAHVRQAVHRWGMGRAGGSDTIDVISPHTEELVGRVPEGTEADIDRAVAAARDAFDNGDWPRMSPAERIADRPEVQRDLRRAHDGHGRGHHRGDGLADLVLAARAVAGAVDDAQHLPPDRRASTRGRRSASGCPRQRRHRASRRRRRRRRDRAVERAAVRHDVEARAGAARRLRDRHQAVAGDAARRVPHGRAARRGRRPEGRRQRRPRRPRGRRAPRASSGRRQDRVHRFDRGRPSHRQHLRRATQARTASSSAASRPRSSSTTPTSPRPSKASSSRRS